MIPIPDYLREYASEGKQKGNRLYFSLRCPCGCEAFCLSENTYSEDEKILAKKYEKSLPDFGFHSIYGGTDSDGKPYSYIKILGLFRKRITFPDIPVFMRMNVIKALCSQCRKEIILFDSRYHGCNGMTSEDEEARNYQPLFSQRNNKPHGIIVAVENEPSLEAFNDAINGQYPYEVYADSFIGISIYSTEENGRKKLLYDFETA